MVSHHPLKFGGHRPCGSGDIIFFVAEKEISDAVASIHHYRLFFIDMSWKHAAYHFINSDVGHTHSKQ